MIERYQKILAAEAAELKKRLPQGKMADMFEQCYRNTIDTTVKELADGSLFVITGDIEAMWLRDSAAQVHHYLPAAVRHEEIYELIQKVLQKQMSYINRDPYANAFNMTANGRHYAPDRSGQTEWTWERKYEVDSLCFPIALAYELWKVTGRAEHLNGELQTACKTVILQWEREQNHETESSYRFERDTDKETETLKRNGLGSPAAYTGMTWSGFRPSDDAGIPGLLSMPYFGFCDASDPVYQNTRKMVLSKANPYYFEGTRLTGIRSPHTKPDHVWSMALITQALTTEDGEETAMLIKMLTDSDAGTGYIHESIHKDDETIYTRPWFAWVNSLFSELVMKKFIE